MTASEKAKNLTELAAKLELDGDSQEAKLLSAALELICELARDVEDLETNTASLAVAISEVSSDIAYLEDMRCETEEQYGEAELVCGGDCSDCSGCGEKTPEE